MTDDTGKRLNALERKIDSHEASCEAHRLGQNQRLDRIEARIDRLANKVDKLLWAVFGLLGPTAGAVIFIVAKLL